MSTVATTEVWIAVTYDGEDWYPRRLWGETAPERAMLHVFSEHYGATGARWQRYEDGKLVATGDPVWRVPDG